MPVAMHWEYLIESCQQTGSVLGLTGGSNPRTHRANGVGTTNCGPVHQCASRTIRVLKDQADRGEPGHERQLRSFHDRARAQTGLVATAMALPDSSCL